MSGPVRVPTAPAMSVSDVLDYYISWEDILETGETIQTSGWDSPLTLGTQYMDTTVTGTDGTYAHSNGVYVSAPSGFSGIAILTNTITTSAGRTYARSMYIPVLDIE